MSARGRAIRHLPVSDCISRLDIEPLLVHATDDPLVVIHRAAERPQTRVLGVVDDAGVLVGVLSIVRLAEAVIVRVAPEVLLSDITDADAAARFGSTVGARTVSDVMLPPAIIAADASLDEAFRRMHALHLSGLYVVDAGGRPTGYLDLMELTMFVAEAIEADSRSTD